MDPAFWLERWARGDIPWHQPEGNALLRRHWDGLGLPAGSLVFVPLCGKSPDLAWLAARGHRILGIELSALAIRDFFAERGLEPRRRPHRLGWAHEAGPYCLIEGDAFALQPQELAECAGFYDRAALVALPPAMRGRYAREVLGALPPGCRGLLITIEFPEAAHPGPPFPVGEDELRALLPAFAPVLIERVGPPEDATGAGSPRSGSAVWRLVRGRPR
ncbi:MAG: thiopurine S-methyltransferase [Xanthomonadales bacterium]|nr:thiopurine S-methyltransferase [Xanthomonadales bacterium]